MRSRRIPLVALAATTVFTVTAWALQNTPPTKKALLLPSEWDVRPGVQAKGFIGLSEPLNSLDASPRRVRVLALDLTFFSDGTDVTRAYGVSVVGAEGREPYQYKGGGYRAGKNRLPGEEKMPRSYGVVIRPKDNRTWAALVNEDELEITFQWEPQPSP